jgi:tetratricopeptide (TPR) repeat protein
MSLRCRFTAGVLATLCLAASSNAIFLRVEVEKVPVERLTANLSEAVKKNPKDAASLVNLARVHAMAYSLRSNELPVNYRMPGEVWFGHEPKLVPFSTIAKADAASLVEAKKHLKIAIDLYAKAVELKPDDLKARLGHAWLLSQTEKKQDAIAALRKVVEQGWEKDQKLQVLGLGGHTVTGEGAGYLIPLLDAKKDAEEIAKLKERIEKLAKLPRPITPVAIPLKDGLNARDLENRSARVPFDADGTGLKKSWTWINRDAAWLVHDPKRSGKIDSGLQLFGNVTFWLFWNNGYDALAALDDNGDGRLTGAELEGLALWHDANGNGVSDPGEVKPLAEHGITALSCRYERDGTHPDRIAYSRAGVTFTNGRTRPTYDIVLHPAK